MPITFSCSCGQQLLVDKQLAGGQVGCPACGNSTSVPRVGIAVSSARPSGRHEGPSPLAPRAAPPAHEMPWALPAAPPLPACVQSGPQGAPSTGGNWLALPSLEDRNASAADIATKLATANQLGHGSRHYMASSSFRVVWVLSFPVMYAIVAARLAKSWGNEPWFAPVAIGGGIAVMLIAVAVILVVLLTKSWQTYAFLYEAGLVRVQESRGECCRWDMVREVLDEREEHQVLTTRTIVLTLLDGRELKFADMDNSANLVASIQSTTGPILMQRVWSEIQCGRAAWFGPSVGIDLHGVLLGQRRVPWQEIKQVAGPDEYGKIYLIPRTGWSKIKVGDIGKVPNYFIFVSLANHLHGQSNCGGS